MWRENFLYSLWYQRLVQSGLRVKLTCIGKDNGLRVPELGAWVSEWLIDCQLFVPAKDMSVRISWAGRRTNSCSWQHILAKCDKMQTFWKGSNRSKLHWRGNKGRLNSGNAFQNLLSSRLLSKNIKIKIHESTILPVALYGCETRSLTLQEDHWTGGSGESLDLTSKWDEVNGHWRELHEDGVYNLYSLNMVCLKKSRRMRLMGL
jgi:hypothetical protein